MVHCLGPCRFAGCCVYRTPRFVHAKQKPRWNGCAHGLHLGRCQRTYTAHFETRNWRVALVCASRNAGCKDKGVMTRA